MSDNLENLLRRWAATGGQAPRPPQPPSDRCLSFPRAEAVARQGTPDDQTSRHLADCPRCRALVADLREALADAPAILRLAETRQGPRVLGLPRRLVAGLAAAAGLLLAVGIGIHQVTRPGDAGALLAAVDVGTSDEIDTGLRSRAVRAFATGDRIKLGVRLRREALLLLLHVDPNGDLEVLKPFASSEDRCVKAPKGLARLGPFVLAGPPGQETLIVAAFGKRPGDLEARIEAAKAEYRQRRDLPGLIRHLRAWPAEVEVVRVKHTARKEGR